MLWKHKLHVAVATLILTGGAYAFIARMPDVYRADAVVIVDSQKIPEKFVASTVQVGLQDSLNAITQQVLNSSQLMAIIDSLGLYREERKTKSREEILALMKNDLVVNLERGLSGSRTGAFRITFDGPDRVVVAQVVNRVTELFIRENFKNREERAAGTSEFLEAQLKQAKKSLDEQEASLSQFKIRVTGELPQQEGALMGALSRLQAEMQANEEAIHRAEQNKLLLENTLQNAEIALNATTQSLVQYQQPRPAQSNRSEVPLEPVKPETRHRPSDDIRARLDAARLRYFDDYPEVKNLKRELDLALATEARADAAEAQRAARTPLPTRTAPKETPAVETPAISAATIETLNRERERIATTKTQIELLDTEITTRNADRGRI